MRNLKKMMCLILAAAMIIVATPVDSYAGEILEGEIDLVEVGDFDETESFEEETMEVPVEAEETEEEIQIIAEDEDNSIKLSEDTIADESLSAKELNAKWELAAELEVFDNLVPGIDYVDGTVYSITYEKEEAEKIADLYGITLTSCELSVASYKLPDDVSVSEIIHLAADLSNDYPVVYPNYIFKTCNDAVLENFEDFETASEDEIQEVVDDDMNLGLCSAVSEDNLFNDPYLSEADSHYQWHHDVIGSPYAWASEIDGKGVKIAILSGGTCDADSFGDLFLNANDDGIGPYFNYNPYDPHAKYK